MSAFTLLLVTKEISDFLFGRQGRDKHSIVRAAVQYIILPMLKLYYLQCVWGGFACRGQKGTLTPIGVKLQVALSLRAISLSPTSDNLANKESKFLSTREKAKTKGEDAPQSRGQRTTQRNLCSPSTLRVLGFKLSHNCWPVMRCRDTHKREAHRPAAMLVLGCRLVSI